MIYFITGGARSGKSSFAQNKALLLAEDPVYVATAKVYAGDTEFEARVHRHKADRHQQWTNFEEPLYVSQLPLKGRTVVIDCVTLWLTNFFSLYKRDIDACLKAIKKEVNTLIETEGNFLIISNEIGMGVHAETEIGRKFTDLQGWTNQYIAHIANQVILMISGIPVVIKQ